MAKKDTSTLICSSCGHENELERVYCHSCGQKLDRSLLPRIEEKKIENPEKQRRRVEKMMNPKRSFFGTEIKTLLKVGIFAALVAAIVLMLRQPEGAPEKNDNIPNRIASDIWGQLIDARVAASATLTEDELSYSLTKAIRKPEGVVPGVKFESAFVKLKPGIATVTLRRNVWGLPFFTSMGFTPVAKDGSVTLEPASVYYGKLAIHPKGAEAGKFGIGILINALEKEIKAGSQRLSDIRVGEGTVTFVTKPQP
jgi:hypothetical protein